MIGTIFIISASILTTGIICFSMFHYDDFMENIGIVLITVGIISLTSILIFFVITQNDGAPINESNISNTLNESNIRTTKWTPYSGNVHINTTTNDDTLFDTSIYDTDIFNDDLSIR